MLRKSLVICLVVILILPALFSCSPPNSSETLPVPGAVNLVEQIQVSKILYNSALNLAYGQLVSTNQTWPQTTTDALNKLLDKTGIDLTSVSTILLFADVESTNETENTYGGLIASGTFNEPALIANVQKQTQQTFTTSNYKGRTVYAEAQNKFEIAFLSQSRLVLGTPKAVRDAIDVSKGDQKPLGGNITETLNRFGPALITGAFAPPENLRNLLADVVPDQPSLSPKAFKDIDTIGFAVDQPSLSLSIRIDAHFTNAASLQDARDEITGLISVAKGVSQDPNVKSALGNIQASTSDSWLSVSDLILLTDIPNLIGSVQPHK